MKRKYILFILSCILVAAVLTACAEKHTHTPQTLWQMDGDFHWTVCTDCQEIINRAEHTLNDENICTVCTCEIIDWGEAKSLCYYDQYKNPLKIADYDISGETISETLFTYRYDADGNVVYSTITQDGILSDENEYMIIDGESLIRKVTTFQPDGSKYTNEYDIYGNVIRLVEFDPDGNAIYEAESEYDQQDSGEWYECKCTYLELDGTKTVAEYDLNGNTTVVVYYHTDGTVESTHTWEYVYDEDGKKLFEKHYCDGVLMDESQYKTTETEDYSVNFPEIVTQYHDNGTKTVTVYDENGEIISQESV